MGGQRVAGVRRNRRRRHDREQLVDERRRVARERGPGLHPLEAQLRPTLAESDEEREQEGAEQQPLRDPDVDGDRAGRRPEHEQPRDRDHVDELERLQAERVRGLEDREREHARERRGAERRTEGQRERAEGRCERERRPGRELAARDRTPALDRMQAVGGDVAHVVDEVGGARRRAVRDERGDRRHPPARVAELRGEHDPREQEEVLRPLARPERSEGRDDGRPPAWELEDRRVGGFHHGTTLVGRQRLRGARRQDEPEAAAPTGLGVELDPAAQCSGELLRDREAEPGALGVVRDERAEDPLGVLAPDTRPRVGDVHPHGAVRRLERDPDRCRRRASSGTRS